SGRASKSEFWWFTLLGVIAHLAVRPALLAILPSVSFNEVPFFLALIFFGLLLTFYIPWMAAGSRRFHDIGWYGWLVAVPFVLALPSYIPFNFMWVLVGDAGPPTSPLLNFFAGLYFANMMYGFWLLPLVAAIFAYFLSRPSQSGPNKYGPPPAEAAS
ncbi:MAG: DUF805 domain-containing protein, partial [Roseobacter sp.]